MWYVILLAVCIGGDQLLKWWVTSHLDVGQSAPLLPGIVRLTRPLAKAVEQGTFTNFLLNFHKFRKTLFSKQDIFAIIR